MNISAIELRSNSIGERSRRVSQSLSPNYYSNRKESNSTDDSTPKKNGYCNGNNNSIKNIGRHNSFSCFPPPSFVE